MKQQSIKNKIWSNLDRLRTDKNFSGLRDTKLVELVGTTFGAEKLDSIFQVKLFSLQSPSEMRGFFVFKNLSRGDPHFRSRGY